MRMNPYRRHTQMFPRLTVVVLLELNSVARDASIELVEQVRALPASFLRAPSLWVLSQTKHHVGSILWIYCLPVLHC